MCSFGGEPSFKLLKLDQMTYFFSFGHFEHLLALVLVAMYT
jgi:hypothetical protein